MPFEFAFLDWLYQFRNPVMNTISIFFDYAGAHGEIWIAFTLLLLLFPAHPQSGFRWRWCRHGGGALLPQAAVRPSPPLRSQHLHHHAGGASARALLPPAHCLRGGGSLRAGFGAGLYRLYPAAMCTFPPIGGAVLGIALGAAASAIANYMANLKKKHQIVAADLPVPQPGNEHDLHLF